MASLLETPSPSSVRTLRNAPYPGVVPSNTILFDSGVSREGVAWRGQHPLSVRTVYRGVRRVRLRDRDFRLDGANLLVINENEPYAIQQRPQSEGKSLTLFFSRELIADSTGGRDARFEQHVFPTGQPVATNLERMWDLLDSDAEPLFVEEQYLATLASLLDLHQTLDGQRNAIQAVGSAVRDEIYRRLCAATDYARDNLSKPLEISQLAYVACMSRTHFLRCFKQAFGKSPGEAISEWRYQKAEFLLKHSDAPVAQICTDVGFQSLSSFIRGFRRYTGKNPTIYRCERLPRKVFGPL